MMALGIRMIGEFDPDPPLTPEEQAKVSALTAEQLQTIDAALLVYVVPSWRKVARVVGSAMMDLDGKIEDIPDIFYAERVRELVRSGIIESQGNLMFMRYSEVRRV
jgi:hypothetical protein